MKLRNAMFLKKTFKKKIISRLSRHFSIFLNRSHLGVIHTVHNKESISFQIFGLSTMSFLTSCLSSLSLSHISTFIVYDDCTEGGQNIYLVPSQAICIKCVSLDSNSLIIYPEIKATEVPFQSSKPYLCSF